MTTPGNGYDDGVAEEARLLAGRYRLERLLGRGGMGEVWQARDETLGRPVAVKQVRFPPGISPEERDIRCERTMREARLTARLSHPAIVTVYDVVSADGQPCIVMELVAAPSLAQVIDADGPVEPGRAAAIGVALIDALEAAHAAGVLHRDVKPSNVLLDGDRVVLTDFGIATSESDVTLTSTGLLVGSPTYMSPERLRAKHIGPPADLWSLGATLYAALEARPPFRAETTMGTITAVLADEVPPPHVEGPLRSVLLGLLDKEPDRRLRSRPARQLLMQAVTAPPPPLVVPAPDGDTTTIHLPVAPVMAPVAPPSQLEDFFVAAPETPERQLGRPLLLLAAVVVLLGGGLVLAGQLGGGDPGSTTATQRSGSTSGTGATGQGNPGRAPTRRPSASNPSASASPSPPASTSPAAPEARPGRGVPAGYQRVHDPLGFTVAVPDGWTRRLAAPTRVDYVSPDGTQFLRVDQQPQAEPSAEQAWLDAEPAVAARLPGYQRISIAPVDYRYPAADWEFTWQAPGGTIHVLNRGIVTDPRGFALYMSGPDATWESASRPVFQTAAATFRPH